NGPEKRSAARPAGHEQHPGVGRDVPEGQNNDPVEKEHDVQEIVSLNQGGGRTHSMNQQDDAADQKDHQIGKDNYSERDYRDDHQGDYGLRQDGCEIGDWQRFPKENTPPAALTVERLETVEH